MATQTNEDWAIPKFDAVMALMAAVCTVCRTHTITCIITHEQTGNVDIEMQYLLFQIIYNLYFHPLANIPGPRTWSASRLPFVRALLRGTIVHDFERLHGIYGPVLRVAPNEVTFADEAAWADIFQTRTDSEQFLKDPLWWGRQPGQPNSLLSAIDPEEHANIRKLLVPAFTPHALRAQEPIIHQYVNLLVERMQELVTAAEDNGEETVDIDMTPWFHFTTFDIFGDLGFGESFNCLQSSKYHPWIALLFNSVKAASFIAAVRYYPLLQSLLFKCIPKSLRKMQMNHFQQIVEKVDRRLNWELERPDIMSHVIDERKGAVGLPIGVIHATFMILTTAGSETTATVLSGAMNYLANNPDKLEILAAEVRKNFHSEAEISLDALRQLPYLNAVINEALRLCPPVPWVLPRRVPPSGGQVAGVWLPGGTPVSIQAYTMNRRPSYFHLPASFLPERWLPEATTDSKSKFFKDHRHAVQPFSTGPRHCLGQHLAWAEMRLILAKLIWNFDFAAVPHRTVRWEDLRTFLLVEKKPMLARVSRRR